MGKTRGSAIDQFGDCGLEGSIPRETDALMKPQAIIVELRNVGKCVISTGMSIAGQIADFFKAPENTHP